MINYSSEWKKLLNLHQVPYDEFVSLSFNNGTYMEKVDGMLGTLIYENGRSFFQTTTAKEIFDIPLNKEYEDILQSMNVTEAKIPGELVAIKNGKILPFNDTQSVVKRFKEEKNKDLIYHFPVDVISLNGNVVNFNNAPTLIKKFSKGKHIESVKVVSGDIEIFRKLFLETMKPGYDGVVARNVNGKNYKVKFINSVDLVIIGAGNFNLPSWPRKQVSYLLTSFLDKKGLFRSSSKVGTGFTISQRSKFYDLVMSNQLYELKGDIYIKPKYMIEVKYFRSRITPTPSYVFTGKEFVKRNDEISVTFSHPSFVRSRPDKQVSKLNARLEQIPDFNY